LKKPTMGLGGFERAVLSSMVGDGRGENDAREARRRARTDEAKYVDEVKRIRKAK
jgi:hypothetical protein